MTPYYQDDAVTIYHGDCREILPSLPRADLLFADPPYHVGIRYASYHDRVSSVSGYAHELVSFLRLHSDLVVVTPGTVNLFAYPDPDAMVVRFDRTAQSPSGVAWMNKWEPVLIYGKHPKRLAWDVIETATQSERAGHVGKLDHPVPKCIGLLHPLVDTWTEPGGLVVDPFLGSGTTARAAKNLDRKAIGIEIEERYCEIAAQRCAQDVLDLGGAT